MAGDVAVPPNEIRSVTAAAAGTGPSVADIEQALSDTGYSRFPVVGTDGRFLGFVHIKDMLDLVDHTGAVVSASAVRDLPRLPAGCHCQRRCPGRGRITVTSRC